MLNIPCGACGAALRRARVPGQENYFCNSSCYGEWRKTQTGTKSPRFSGGAKMTQGRVLLLMPWHHRADCKGYVLRYVIVAELKLGRPLTPEEHVHHIDEDPGNDHPDNLRVFPSNAEHARFHAQQRSADKMAAMRAARGNDAAE